MWSKGTATRAGFAGVAVAVVLTALGIYLSSQQDDPGAAATPSAAQRRVRSELALHDIEFDLALGADDAELIGEEKAIDEVGWNVKIKQRSEPMLGYVTTDELVDAPFYAFRVSGRLWGPIAGPAMPLERNEPIQHLVHADRRPEGGASHRGARFPLDDPLDLEGRIGHHAPVQGVYRQPELGR